MQGGEPEVVSALSQGGIAEAPITAAERTLLELVATITRQASRVTRAAVDRVREAGWSDEQIAEAVYITALFAFFNRVADAFGLEDPGYLQQAAAGQAPPPPASHGN